MKRRSFHQRMSAALLATFLARPLRALAPLAQKNEIGLQLWTVRQQMATDRTATLQAIADAGYGQVELMNVLDSAAIVQGSP
ncbi:MAG: hypothetical protein KatS3mg111_3511 [Pirellulaceae bacterium]|nr:MAG: hypothetical protein KatS3mg111_3511 [Pirellulaceae bacterium]